MSEVEFERLLEAVSVAMAPRLQDSFLSDLREFDTPPQAANDNQIAWPYIPFPDGWNAAC